MKVILPIMNLEITSMIYMLMELNNNSVMSGLSV